MHRRLLSSLPSFASSRVVAGVVVAGAAASGCLALVFPYSPENLFETRVRAECAFAFRCCLPSERNVTDLQGFRDEDSCIRETLEQGGPLAGLGLRAQEVIASGNGEFDDELAEKCTKPGTDARYACDAEAVLAPGAEDPACIAGAARAFVIGKVEDGDACTDDLECIDEGRCVRDGDGDEISLEGKCRARSDKGDDCSERECKTGFVCTVNDNGDLRCAEPTLLDDGEECDDGSECASGFCNTVEERACFFTGDACASDAECDTPGDSCEITTTTQCGSSGPKVELCDGK